MHFAVVGMLQFGEIKTFQEKQDLSLYLLENVKNVLNLLKIGLDTVRNAHL